MNVVLAITGASGALASKLFAERSPWPVTLVASRWGREVYEHECGAFSTLSEAVSQVVDDEDLTAAISSGSVGSAGMVVLPCSTNTMARIAGGMADTLITRAAHCHLKEGRKLVLCVRESPWTLIDINNAGQVCAAGGMIMPMSPPFFMAGGQDAAAVSLQDIVSAYVDRVLSVLGHAPERDWGTIRELS